MSETCRPTEAAADTGPYDRCPHCGWIYLPDAIHWCPKSWEAWKEKAKPRPEGGRDA